MTVVGIIPARYDSTRLPGKPLLDIGGRPMIQWVYEAAKSCAALTHVAVATDSERVADCVQSFQGVVEMTRADHQTGPDRIAEAAEKYPEATVVVNVQGDQPFVTSEMLTSLV